MVLKTIYTCGPTVYDHAHIGNLRSFLLSDLLRRSLEFKGYGVKQVMNITDVDDKIIKASQEQNVSAAAIAQKYGQFFLQDLEKLNIQKPTSLPHATDYIPQMIAMIEKLVAKGVAYQAEDGVYFKISAIEDYGKLGQKSNDEQNGDFALWKNWKETDGVTTWDSPWGRGRPGWHIECSAMIAAEIGDTVDYHTGGTDLIFPHHTNEIAQSETVTGRPLARQWLHGAFVNVDGQKMSKSLGNIITLHQIEEKGFSPLALRYWFLTAHYKSIVNFTWEALAAAQTALDKLYDLYLDAPDGESDQNAVAEFQAALDDDLNTPKALSLVWKLEAKSSKLKATLLKFDEVLGLRLAEVKPTIVPPEIAELAQKREVARRAQDWAEADRLRAEIEQHGFSVRDTDAGPKIKKI